MKHVSILVLETAVPAAIVDPRYMFSAINDFLKIAELQPAFSVNLVGLNKEVTLQDGLISIHTDATIKDIKKTDLIIIPALSGNMQEAIKKNSAYLPWITEHYKKGTEVASLCVGAFLLASTGILKGKSCSTHWLFANEFRTMFPDVTLTDDKIITDQNGIYSSGGATSYWNLLLYLVEKYTNREMAIMASKFFLLEMDRNTQSQFVMFKGQKDHDDLPIIKAQEFIEKHFAEKITVDELAEKFGIGRRTFERRFKKATTNTVIEYIQRVKIEAAKKQLESGRKTVNEVMYDVGYTDVKAFRDVFKKVAGMSPVDYRNKYNK
ncbi:GlxA family transcriptional regulator [Cytophaga hutchinsonii]|uniref:Transcriptional regulator, AraC family with amidase-like domain n=1 Tax=Cytophaga hutchinsonii (strain ATCC 33406 / DSM 1761 / CIP 103989 / NBRC 15051 / NCIMB 9469 / D465) TaxID=269798 RepID=A0A6N4SXF1_CYTH3|nr:helix-turn-helix domain-containing protein [Cytophaga hutchinsonii]ABG61019.1 transcriptional regulator, AraC family with amidase-like domain [Cytophaga hutchinsonii ATCC 33406]SFX44480.1 transcriptional regulator, AraC family with amidase-like domain [Cytophaga hutchinsonii ATCC 33406]